MTTGSVSEVVDGPRRRLLVPITYGLSVRYLLPTGVLAGLSTICDPVVALGWDDGALADEVARLGIEVVRLPAARLDHDYRMYRRRLDVLHQRRLRSPTAGVLRALGRARDPRWVRAIGGTRRALDEVRVRRPGGATAVEAGEAAAVESGTNVGDFARFLRDERIDAVLSVTPYHDEDGLVLWAARAAGLPTVTSVISFDNPTTRARMMSRSDRILVWNRYNADEIDRSYPDVTADRIGVIGAPQFDLHRRADLLADEASWRYGLGLPADRPIVLWGAGPSSLVLDEHRLIEVLDRAIDEDRVPGRPFVLVRRHPADPSAPWVARSRALRHSLVVDPWAAGSDPNRSWPTHADLVAQVSSWAHSAVHVNVCSSMTIDGAVFDRPQVGPAFVPGNATASSFVHAMYGQEHWAPIARSGGVEQVHDERSLVAAVAEGLEHPERRREGRRRLVEELLTYLDGRSSERLVAEVASVLGADSSSRS